MADNTLNFDLDAPAVPTLTLDPTPAAVPQEEKPDMTMRMSKIKTPTITRTSALPLAAFISPFTAVLTAVLPFSTA